MMSNVSGSTKNQTTLRTQAGVTVTQAAGMSGADLMRAALLAKAGLNTTTGATLSGANLQKSAGTAIELGV